MKVQRQTSAISSPHKSRRLAMFAYIASLMAMNGDDSVNRNTLESKHKSTRGKSTKYLPGGLRGMSQRQRRKRVRWGILDG